MRRYGFNLQWMFWKEPGAEPAPVDERVLDAIASWGFDFVRMPCDYRFWTRGLDYTHPDERVLQVLDGYLAACRERGLHLSLNLHRAPGYVITGWESEHHNLWADQEAQDGFAGIWTGFAQRHLGVPAEALSFDLVNEPPSVGERGFTRDAHEAVIRRVVAEIRKIDPERPLVIDGLGGGHLAMPELADLGVIHSTRGYQPMSVSHYRAEWWPGSPDLPEPAYPGDYDGRHWDRAALRDFYAPWLAVAARGVPVHVGEFGCYEYSPNDVALRWLADVLGVFASFGWGYALWQFEGPFGVVGHRRPGARFERLDGFEVDRDLLELLQAHRAGAVSP
ncbi:MULTISPECIES: cellulase family glycosylhydrolase [unclassified Nonomuraea]|uniref:glycoside hydrolase family 5 protein n=1 Tax=unclassified Nonomuraea TaxID=2593643 RepID=UPI00340B054B